jgi:NAD(P)-dependent dehydrogenase (short-subunit alcohol dehydrogenase family)
MLPRHSASTKENALGTLDGKVAIITGAGGRLGKASVLAMAGAGAAVLAVDRVLDGAEAICEAAARVGGKAIAHQADVSDEADVSGMIAMAVAQFGGVDVMFNNAGLIGLEHLIGLLDLDVELWDQILAVNLRGVMLGCKHVVPAMIGRGGGSIINTSSDASLAGDVVNLAYAAAKAGVNTLTAYVAASFGKHNIRCNAISPGIHLNDDDIVAMGRAGGFRAEMYACLEEHCLLPRLGTPDDIAKAAVFLASDEAAYITGQVIQVDGGLIGHVPHLADVRRLGGAYGERSRAKPDRH